MIPNLFYAPFLAMIFLTFLVWAWMMTSRLISMVRNRVWIEELQTDAGYEKIKDAENPSENFINLFEVPILFYVLMLVLIQSQNSDPALISGAWAFVFGRTMHSVIHCASKVVLPRAFFFVTSTGILLWMWIRFALSVF